MPKVVFLGLDGATFDVVEPWVAAGELPTLGRLMREGATARLTSTEPAVTPAAWPSIYTGVNPGKHGLFAFQRRVPDAYRWVANTATDNERAPFWDLAATEGARSAVLFAPYTWPAAISEGVLVAGRGAPAGTAPQRSSPNELASELAARFGQTQLFGARRPANANLGQIRRGLIESIRGQADATVEVVSREAWDVVVAVWDQTDTAAHLFWHHSEPCPDTHSPMFEVYREVDTSLGRVLDAAGNDSLVVVCSDHGAYPISHRVRMPLWLAEKGYLNLQRSLRGAALARAGTAWMKVPERIRKMVPRTARRGIGAVHEQAFRQNGLVDWDRTHAYPEPVVAESIYLNLRGREPRGTVPPSAYEEMVEAVKGDALEMVAPDGRGLVSAVLRGRDIYEGPRAGQGPDLVLETAKGVYLSPTPAGLVFDTPEPPDMEHGVPRSLGYHDPEGLLIVTGPGVKPGALRAASVYDVAPTILCHLGATIPRDVDGRVLEEVFVEPREPRFGAVGLAAGRERSLTGDEEADIERQLRDLGYIE